MPWVNIFDIPGVSIDNVQAATCGGSGNTLYTDDNPNEYWHPPTQTMFIDDEGHLNIDGEDFGEGGLGPVDGFVLRDLPPELAGKRIRIQVVHCDILDTKHAPFGEGPTSGFAAFSCYWHEGLEAWFQDEGHVFLGATTEYGADDGKSSITTEPLTGPDRLRIRGIDTGDGVMVDISEGEPPFTVGTLPAAAGLGMWLAVEPGPQV